MKVRIIEPGEDREYADGMDGTFVTIQDVDEGSMKYMEKLPILRLRYTHAHTIATGMDAHDFVVKDPELLNAIEALKEENEYLRKENEKLDRMTVREFRKRRTARYWW